MVLYSGEVSLVSMAAGELGVFACVDVPNKKLIGFVATRRKWTELAFSTFYFMQQDVKKSDYFPSCHLPRQHMMQQLIHNTQQKKKCLLTPFPFAPSTLKHWAITWTQCQFCSKVSQFAKVLLQNAVTTAYVSIIACYQSSNLLPKSIVIMFFFKWLRLISVCTLTSKLIVACWHSTCKIGLH